MTQKKWRFFTWTRDNHKAFADAVAEELDTKASKETVDQLVAGTVSKSGDTISGHLALQMSSGSDNTVFPLTIKGNFKDSKTTYSWSIGLATIGEIFYIKCKSSRLIGLAPGLGLFTEHGAATLGCSIWPWPKTFTKKLNNGADIEIPNKAGTMALVSDIEEILRKHKLIPDEPETQTE